MNPAPSRRRSCRPKSCALRMNTRWSSRRLLRASQQRWEQPKPVWPRPGSSSAKQPPRLWMPPVRTRLSTPSTLSCWPACPALRRRITSLVSGLAKRRCHFWKPAGGWKPTPGHWSNPCLSPNSRRSCGNLSRNGAGITPISTMSAPCASANSQQPSARSHSRTLTSPPVCSACSFSTRWPAWIPRFGRSRKPAIWPSAPCIMANGYPFS